MTLRQSRWKQFQKFLIRFPLPIRQTIEDIRFLRLKLMQQHYWFERADRKEFFRKAFVALNFNGIDGDYAEFGCHGGMTFLLGYQQAKKRKCPCMIWGFDSFSGLPAQTGREDVHPEWVRGAMHTDLDEFHFICKYNGIPLSDYRVVPGFYEDTLQSDLSATTLPRNICLAYIDCDLYSSTVSVLNFLSPRLKQGMIIALDDYYCWSSTQISGEKRALEEFFENNESWRLDPYVQYGWGGMSFVVVDKKM